MDESHHIDGAPSVKLGIEISNNKGDIWLSSIYESYNYKSNIEIPPNEIAKFTCPHCNEKIKSDDECDQCGSPMVPLSLSFSGTVSLCSKSGCKNHFLEFEDVSNALSELYAYGKHYEETPSQIMELPSEEKEIIKSGNFLQTYCPECNKSLIKNNVIKLRVINNLDESGTLFLSPYLNVFTLKSTVFLHEDQVIKDLKCIHCDTSLIVDDIVCVNCNSPVAKLKVSARTKLIDFYLCSKKGCKWHGLNKKDLHDIDLEDSLEW